MQPPLLLRRGPKMREDLSNINFASRAVPDCLAGPKSWQVVRDATLFALKLSTRSGRLHIVLVEIMVITMLCSTS